MYNYHSVNPFFAHFSLKRYLKFCTFAIFLKIIKRELMGFLNMYHVLDLYQNNEIGEGGSHSILGKPEVSRKRVNNTILAHHGLQIPRMF